MPGLRGLFVHHVGQGERPAWSAHCERWSAVSVGKGVGVGDGAGGVARMNVETGGLVRALRGEVDVVTPKRTEHCDELGDRIRKNPGGFRLTIPLAVTLKSRSDSIGFPWSDESGATP